MIGLHGLISPHITRLKWALFYKLTAAYFDFFHRKQVHCNMALRIVLLLRLRGSCRGPHEDVIKWKHFPRYWPFVRGIHRSPVNSAHKGQWRGALMFSLICVWINGWVKDHEAGDLGRHHAHYDVIVMYCLSQCWHSGNKIIRKISQCIFGANALDFNCWNVFESFAFRVSNHFPAWASEFNLCFQNACRFPRD